MPSFENNNLSDNQHKTIEKSFDQAKKNNDKNFSYDSIIQMNMAFNELRNC